jgi:hypothetical protein
VNAIAEAVIHGAGIIQLPKYLVAAVMSRRQIEHILQNYTSKQVMSIAVMDSQKDF